MNVLKTVVIAICLTGAIAHAATMKVANPRVEYKSSPLGIDVRQPRLSWVLEATDPAARGLRQSAYEILIASSRQQLDGDRGDLWSTGKVDSDETIQIAYDGKALASRQECWWKVRVWSGDPKEEPTAWSEPARWTMGLLDPAGDWQAKWIGYDEPDGSATSQPAAEAPVNLDKLKWIWTTEGDATKDAPAGDRFFARKLELPKDHPLTGAQIILTCDDSCEIIINGHKAGGGGDFHRAMTFDVMGDLKPGDNVLAVRVHNDRGPAGLIGRLVLWVEGAAEPVGIDIDKSWKFATTQPAQWEKSTFDFADWPAAKEVLDVGGQPWGTPAKTTISLKPPPMLRKSFTTDKTVKRATMYATARGLYELHINGEKVGNDLLTPGWTNFKRRVYYNTYDVTSMLNRGGENVIGALLGGGWYCGYIGGVGRPGFYGPDPRLMAQLEIEYEDGSHSKIITDDSWKCAYGPWREGDLLMGSSYDARREMAHWDEPGFDDSAWKSPAVEEPGTTPAVQAHPGDPVRKHEELPAKSVAEPLSGVYVFDLGQNMVGWTRLKLSGQKPGTKIEIRHSEMLNPDRTPYLTSLRSARAMDTYICKGGEEIWEPKFTFHGFRYVQVKGLKPPLKPSLGTITGVVVGSDIPRTGEFECSNPLVNQLFHNIIWGQKGNYLEVPTDCPQRDERLGWTGDAQFFVRTGAYNFDVSAFFTKWLVDLITDTQYADGSFADVAPDVLGAHGNVAWGDAGIVCPYTIYKVYGDARIIERHYDSMVKYIDYLKKTSKDLIRGQGSYGDWVNLGGGAKSEVIGTAYFCYVTKLMSEMAGAIGKDEDAANYAKLSDDIRAAFEKNFVARDGSIKESSQTGYALAFTMDLIPAEKRAAAAEKFVKEIEKHNWHLATGFIGTPRLLPALTLAGRNDVAYRLLLTETFPSWLFQVKLGATTMWERWDGWTPDKGFQDPAMNSFNHYAFGSVGEWIFRTAGGIDTDGPGFKRITLKPQPGEGLSFARAKYDSIRGIVQSGWKREGDGRLTLKFTVPPNTSATTYVPTSDPASITEGGKPIAEAAGVKFMWSENGTAVYRLTSGTYEFSAKQ